MRILSTKKPEKSLTFGIKKHSGRNNQGKITVRHRGGGSRKVYRLVDFGQEKIGLKGTVKALEYDPNRNAHIALVEYEDEQKAYIIAPHKLKEGDAVLCNEKTELEIGNRMMLKHIPVGTLVHNVELVPGKGGVIGRGAGTAIKVLANDAGFTQLQMPSTEIRKVPELSFASIGNVSNPEFRFKRVKNAGRNRLKGIRPTVRGSAMNPVDHPHGGGEGKAGIGLKYPKTPWGKPALGVKTRSKKKWTNKFIVKRRAPKKRK